MDESLLHLFYLYKNPSKKVRELKNLYQILKEQFETYGNMFGLYTQHIQNIIADTTKELHPAKLQGKFNKLIESKVILQAAFLLDILAEAKVFSLCTQKADADIIDITDAAQSTQHHYNGLKKKLNKDPELVVKLPTLVSVLSEIKKNDTEKHTKIKSLIISHRQKITSKIMLVTM